MASKETKRKEEESALKKKVSVLDPGLGSGDEEEEKKLFIIERLLPLFILDLHPKPRIVVPLSLHSTVHLTTASLFVPSRLLPPFLLSFQRKHSDVLGTDQMGVDWMHLGLFAHNTRVAIK